MPTPDRQGSLPRRPSKRGGDSATAPKDREAPERRPAHPAPPPPLRPLRVSTMRARPDEHLKLVLEPTGLHRAVHPALLGTILLPPPATGAGVGARFNRAGARRTTDTLIPLLVQRVEGHIVFVDVVPHRFVGPVRQRIDFDHAALIGAALG